jgi:hypothetical protein
MAAELLSFFRPAKSVSGDWSTQEIAEFYRVEAALVQAGASVCVDRGVSDEGDPWFVFCRAVDGEVIVHFARIAGKYLIVAESVGLPLRGSDFRRLLADFVELNPSLIPLPSTRGSKLMLHPASLLAAVVATALYHMSGTEAVASAIDSTAINGSQIKSHHAEHAGVLGDGSNDSDRQWTDRQVAVVVAAMVALAAMEFSPPTKEMVTDLASAILELANDQLVLPHQDVAQVLSLPGLNEQSLLGNQIDTHGIHTWLDGLYDYGAGQALLQQFEANANDNGLPKWPTPTTEAVLQQSASSHWWESLSPDADIAPKYFAWADPSTGLSGGGAYGVPSNGVPSTSATPVVVSQLQNQPASPSTGSSSPDQPMPQAFQAASLVNSELSAADHAIPQFNINGNVSLQAAITFGALDVFGPTLPSSLQSVIQHDPTILDAGASPLQSSQTLASASSTQPQPAAIVPTSASATAYQAFDVAASVVIDAFVQQNKSNIVEVISNNHVLLFDTKPADLGSPDFAVKTWSMADGSTISVIGLLPHNLALQA